MPPRPSQEDVLADQTVDARPEERQEEVLQATESDAAQQRAEQRRVYRCETGPPSVNKPRTPLSALRRPHGDQKSSSSPSLLTRKEKAKSGFKLLSKVLGSERKGSMTNIYNISVE